MSNNPIYFNNYNNIKLPNINNNNNSTNKNRNNNIGTQDFDQILKSKVQNNSGELKFSKHATQRIQSRNINLTQDQLKRINDGVQKAANKGVNDSLIIMDKMAFIVNVNNKTVVTAVNNSELKDNVFTNIDGAVII